MKINVYCIPGTVSRLITENIVSLPMKDSGIKRESWLSYVMIIVESNCDQKQESEQISYRKQMSPSWAIVVNWKDLDE